MTERPERIEGTRTTQPNELGERVNQGERFARTILDERLKP